MPKIWCPYNISHICPASTTLLVIMVIIISHSRILTPNFFDNQWQSKRVAHMNFPMKDLVSNVSELLCYSGSAVSAIIAASLLRMGNLHTMTFYNRMFILYFMIDSTAGVLEEYFLFRVKEDRSSDFSVLNFDI